MRFSQSEVVLHSNVLNFGGKTRQRRFLRMVGEYRPWRLYLIRAASENSRFARDEGRTRCQNFLMQREINTSANTATTTQYQLYYIPTTFNKKEVKLLTSHSKTVHKLKEMKV